MLFNLQENMFMLETLKKIRPQILNPISIHGYRSLEFSKVDKDIKNPTRYLFQTRNYADDVKADWEKRKGG